MAAQMPATTDLNPADLLNQIGIEHPSGADMIAATMYIRAMSGVIGAAEYLRDSAEGRPSAPDHNPVNSYLSDLELRRQSRQLREGGHAIIVGKDGVDIV
jgi:hypothetical protein